MFVCYGGDCQIALRDGETLYHLFTVEPMVRGVVPDGPAAGRLREGDVIVAVDGRLITTRAGGERMASLAPGGAVTLRVRREGRELDVTLTPRGECHRPGISIAANAMAEARAQESIRQARGELSRSPYRGGASRTPSGRPRPGEGFVPGPVDFGLSLACSACGWRLVDSQPQHVEFVTAVAPIVAAVLQGGPAEKAGVFAGDTLVALDGFSLTGNVPDSVWTSLRAGRPVRLGLRRGRLVELVVVPRTVRF
jgi:C-terminal processing protease CtpA/Prc